jgi:hypothetical protein
MKRSKKYIHTVLAVSTIVATGLAAGPSPATADAPPCPAFSPVLHGSPPLTDPTSVALRNYAAHAPVQCIA